MTHTEPRQCARAVSSSSPPSTRTIRKAQDVHPPALGPAQQVHRSHQLRTSARENSSTHTDILAPLIVLGSHSRLKFPPLSLVLRPPQRPSSPHGPSIDNHEREFEHVTNDDPRNPGVAAVDDSPPRERGERANDSRVESVVSNSREGGFEFLSREGSQTARYPFLFFYTLGSFTMLCLFGQFLKFHSFHFLSFRQAGHTSEVEAAALCTVKTPGHRVKPWWVPVRAHTP